MTHHRPVYILVRRRMALRVSVTKLLILHLPHYVSLYHVIFSLKFSHPVMEKEVGSMTKQYLLPTFLLLIKNAETVFIDLLQLTSHEGFNLHKTIYTITHHPLILPKLYFNLQA